MAGYTRGRAANGAGIPAALVRVGQEVSEEEPEKSHLRESSSSSGGKTERILCKCTKTPASYTDTTDTRHFCDAPLFRISLQLLTFSFSPSVFLRSSLLQ